MGYVTAIIQFLKIIGQVFSLFVEKDKKQAAKKKENLDNVTDAAKETDPKKRASRLNMALDDINRL
jgi:hypothetical protein